MPILHEFPKNFDKYIIFGQEYNSALSVSIVIFTLYGILGLFDMNKNIHTLTIEELPNITRGGMIYSYVFGFTQYIIKVIINVFTLYIFVLIIMLCFSTIWFLIKEEDGKGMMANTTDVIWSVTVNILGIFVNINFYYIFFLFIPVLIGLIIITYTGFIDVKLIKLENEKDMKKIVVTHHKLLIFLLITFFALGIMSFVFAWQFNSF
jgi:hypothetical protein